MKSLLKGIIKITLILVLPFLLSCATPGPIQQYTQGRIIDRGDYSVPLVLFFRSNFGIESIKKQLRHYGGGLKKLEPKDVENILIPNFSVFTPEDLQLLEETFKAWQNGIFKDKNELNNRINEIFYTLIERYSQKTPFIEKPKMKKITDFLP